MTFLELCQRMRSECFVTGRGPSTVTGQVGELERLVNWTSQAYNEIQSRHVNWRWLRSTFSVNTVAGTSTYESSDCTDTRLSVSLTRFRRWWLTDELGYTNLKAYKLSDGIGTERWIPFMPWARFKAIYGIGTQNNSPLAYCTIDPQNNLVVNKPDDVYVVSGEYQMGNQVLEEDDDEPELPGDHMVIVYHGMEKYGAGKIAVEVFNRSQFEGGRLMRQLEGDQLPEITVGEPLA